MASQLLVGHGFRIFGSIEKCDERHGFPAHLTWPSFDAPLQKKAVSAVGGSFWMLQLPRGSWCGVADPEVQTAQAPKRHHP